MDTNRPSSEPPPPYTANGINHATNPHVMSGTHVVDNVATDEPTSLDYMHTNVDAGADVDPTLSPAATTNATVTTAADRDRLTMDTMCAGCGIPTVSIIYNVLVHAILYGYTIYLSWISFVNKDPYSIFCWHSPLSLLGFSILMTESMLCFSNTNLFTHHLSHRSRVYLHWLLQLAAAICIFAGLMAAVIRKLYRGKTHFRTYHALFGIVAIALSALVMLDGVPTKYAMRFRRVLRPVWLKVSHSALALVAYVVAVVATLLGLYSSTFVSYSGNSESVFYALWVMIVFSGQYVVYGPVTNLCSRVGSIVRRKQEARRGLTQL